MFSGSTWPIRTKTGNNVDELPKKFPLFFARVKYAECDEGWTQLIEELCSKVEPLLQAFIDEGHHAPCASQVKEKYGGLRVYMSESTEEIEALIEEAEDKSLITCEVCGSPGETVGKWWIKTLCEKHRGGYE